MRSEACHRARRGTLFESRWLLWIFVFAVLPAVAAQVRAQRDRMRQEVEAKDAALQSRLAAPSKG